MKIHYIVVFVFIVGISACVTGCHSSTNTPQTVHNTGLDHTENIHEESQPTFQLSAEHISSVVISTNDTDHNVTGIIELSEDIMDSG